MNTILYMLFAISHCALARALSSVLILPSPYAVLLDMCDPKAIPQVKAKQADDRGPEAAAIRGSMIGLVTPRWG